MIRVYWPIISWVLLTSTYYKLGPAIYWITNLEALSPADLLCTSEWQVEVTDLGLAEWKSVRGDGGGWCRRDPQAWPPLLLS